MTQEMSAYYARRAAEYERVYTGPRWQDDLARLRPRVAEFFAGRRVFEVACGTGYWTLVAAEGARVVHATDLNDDTLTLARAKIYAAPVSFERRDAYAPAAGPARFDAGLAGGLVGAHPRDAGEAQREAGRVGRALLDLVVVHLHHDLRPHPHRVAVVSGGERVQSLGHLGELAVGQALEGLAHLRPAVPVAYRQVVVGEPAHAAAGAAIRGHNHAVHRQRGLQLEPLLAPAARLVGARRVLGHEALVAGRERAGHEGGAVLRPRDQHALGQPPAAGHAVEDLPAARVGLVEIRPPVRHQAVEEV